MILRSLSVENFAGVRGPVAIAFHRGINLIHGDNEIGKSTLVKAMYWALTVRSKVTGKPLDEIKPRTGASPRVSVEFEQCGKIYSVLKNYKGPGGTTELVVKNLTGVTESQSSGDNAETELRRVLSISAEVSTGKPKDEECGILPLLWIEQGDSYQLPQEAINDHTRNQLTAFLASQTDKALSGQEGDRVLRAVEEQYLVYYTEKGKEKEAASSPLHQTKKRVEEAESALSHLTKRKDEFDAAIERYYRITRDIEKISGELARRGAECAAAAKRVEAIRELETKLDQDKANFKAAESDLGLCAEKSKTRAASKAALGTQQAEIARLEAAVTAMTARRRLQAETVESETSGVEKLRAAIVADEEKLRRLAKRAQYLQELQEHSKTELTFKTAKAYQTSAAALETELARIRVRPDLFSRLDALDRELDKVKAALESAAAKVDITAAGKFSVDGVEGRSGEISVAKPVTIEFPGVATVRIRPGGSEIKERLDKVAYAKASLDRALADLGVPSMEEARRQSREWTVKDQDLRSARSKLEAVAPKGLGFIESAYRQSTARLEALKTDETADGEPQAITDVETSLAAARRALESLTHRQATLDKELTRLVSELSAASASLDAERRRHQNTKDGLDSHRKLCGEDDALESALAESRRRRDEIGAVLEKRSAEYLSQNPATAHDEHTRLARVVETFRRELQENDRELAGIQALLKSAELIGLHERLGGMEADLIPLRAEEKRHRDRAEACRLLHTTLLQRQQAARKQFMAPLRSTMEPMLNMIFPRSVIEFDEGYNLRSISRDRTGIDDFGALSGGTREQLGIIVRLALAKILSTDESVPVILDDAFGWTDDNRFEKMIPVLFHAARTVQILIFTCHWSRYRNVGLDDAVVTDLTRLRATEEIGCLKDSPLSPVDN